MNWKIRTVVSCLTVFTLICGAMSADAAVVGRAVNSDALGDSSALNLFDSFALTGSFQGGGVPAGAQFVPFGSGFDSHGIFDRLNDSPSFSLMDDSLAVFPGDIIGIIKDQDFRDFFGVADNVNGDNTDGTPYVAEWVFDTTGANGGLSLSIDMAAMGDFEADDSFVFEYSLDGANFSTVFQNSFIDTDFLNIDVGFDRTIDPAEDLGAQAATLTYTMEDGNSHARNDPLTMNGTLLKNAFQTFTANLVGTVADDLTLRFTGFSNGSNEAFVFRDILVEDGAVAGGVAGDYNDNGVVDAADYTVWLDNLGSTTALTNEDPLAATPGVVDQEDYDFWKTRFGAIVGTANGSSIPEPCSALLVLLAALQIGAIRRR